MRLPQIKYGTPVQRQATPDPEAAGSLGREVARGVAVASDIAHKQYLQNEASKYTAASGDAAAELQLLATTITQNNTVPLSEVPTSVRSGINKSTVSIDDEGVQRVNMFEVGNQSYRALSDQIIATHAGRIGDPQMRERFLNDMKRSYQGPGQAAVYSAMAAQQQSYFETTVSDAVDQMAQAGAPTEVIEEKIAQGVALGMDPAKASELRKNALQDRSTYAFQNDYYAATTTDQVDEIMADLPDDPNLSPERRSQLYNLGRQRLADIESQKAERYRAGHDQLFEMLYSPQGLTHGDINRYLQNDMIDPPIAHYFANQVKQIEVARSAALDPDAAKTAWLASKQQQVYVVQAADGLGKEDAYASLEEEILRDGVQYGATAAEMRALIGSLHSARDNENDEEMRAALQLVGQYVGVEYDPFTGSLDGDRHRVEAFMLTRVGLIKHMNKYGPDADPLEYVEKTRTIYDPKNLEDGAATLFKQMHPEIEAAWIMDPVPGAESQSDREGRLDVNKMIGLLQHMRASGNKEKADQILVDYMTYYEGADINPADYVTAQGLIRAYQQGNAQ